MGGTVRILHVDDDPEMTEVTTAHLDRRGGFEVLTATSTQEALETLAGRDVDCVVSDYEMSDRNGLDLLEAVREDDPDLPFILFTGKGSEAIASEAISRGVDDYLQKRMTTDQFTLLANRIENAVEQYRARQRVERLHEATRTFMRREDRESVCEAAVEAVTDVLDFPLCGVWLADGDSALEPVAVTESAADLFEEMPVYEPGNSLSWETFQSGQSTFYEHVDEQPDAYARDPLVESELIVPLGDHGVMNVASTEKRGMTEIDRSLAELLAANVEAALDRAAREEARARSESRFRSLFEQSVDPIYLHTAEGRIVDANERACEALGYTHDELVGMSVSEIEQGRTPAELRAFWAEMDPGEIRHAEGTHARADGSTFPVEVRVGRFETLDEAEFFVAAREVPDGPRPTGG